MKKINFDLLFRPLVLLSIAYFLVLLTIISISASEKSGIGRYQFNSEGTRILDTKTGELKKMSSPK